VAARDKTNADITAADQASADAVELAESTSSGKKGRPTPSRKEREAARKRPLVPDDRRQARKESRTKMNATRERARIGLAAGEERYLPQRDKGPQRKFVRDYVDARTSLGEFLIPVMFLVIIATFIPSIEAQTISILALWGFFLVAIIDSVVLAWLVKRKLAKKFGSADKGVGFYSGMRALQLRVLRLPKPQVKRGEFPVV
jgi:hypothetical protein